VKLEVLQVLEGGLPTQWNDFYHQGHQEVALYPASVRSIMMRAKRAKGKTLRRMSAIWLRPQRLGALGGKNHSTAWEKPGVHRVSIWNTDQLPTRHRFLHHPFTAPN